MVHQLISDVVCSKKQKLPDRLPRWVHMDSDVQIVPDSLRQVAEQLSPPHCCFLQTLTEQSMPTSKQTTVI